MDAYEKAMRFVISNLEANQEYLLMIRSEIIDRTIVFGNHAGCDVKDEEFLRDLTWITLDYINWPKCPELECIMDDRFDPIVNVCEEFYQEEEVQEAVLRILVLED